MILAGGICIIQLNADVIFCVSQAVKDLVMLRRPRTAHIWMLPNKVDFQIMRPVPPEEIEELQQRYAFRFRIIHVGRKSREKNLDTLINALPLAGPDYCLIAIGSGDSGPYQKLAKQCGAEQRCFFLDPIANAELPRFYSLGDCLCVPSRWEGFGIVFIEALACEAVVVTSAIAPMNEYITDGENGLLVNDYEDPSALCQAIRRACTNQELRSTIKAAARRSVARFSKDVVVDQEVALYRRIFELKNQGMFGAQRPVFSLFRHNES